MNLRVAVFVCYALAVQILAARSGGTFCGTYPERWREELDLHAKAERLRALSKVRSAEPVRHADSDVGHIAVMRNDDAIFGRRNPFNLVGLQVAFARGTSGYTYRTTDGGYDSSAINGATAITGIGDDDSRKLALPFSFPFYGESYREVWVNSDGNLTFAEGDSASTERSLGRMAAGAPRIAALFTDLDPSAGAGAIRVLSTPQRMVFTWDRVPEYSDFGFGRPQTFQIRLYPDGKIEMAWETIAVAEGVTGISPGDSPSRFSLAAFRDTRTGSGDGLIAERFGDGHELDLVAAARRFYETHDDSYDYLAFFNAMGSQIGGGTLAFESTVRTKRRGIGDTAVDVGRQYGSAARLQAVLNMGPLSNYPSAPASPFAPRGNTGDTGMTVVAHEAGHLFLAFVSVRDAANPALRPMLGRQGFHWNFRFNSEASILEGNRIQDNGENAQPRFATVATVEGFSPLDQYLMGVRAPEEVPPTFLVEGASISPGIVDPRVGVAFGGVRRNVTVDDLIAVEGRRVPDHTVEQRRYRIAFILIVPEDTEPSAADVAKLERYRAEFSEAYGRFSEGRIQMESELLRSLRLSIEPAAGALVGFAQNLTASLTAPAEVDLPVRLTGPSGVVDRVIPRGARSVSLLYRPSREGVELLKLEAVGNSRYMAAEARLAVAANVGGLQLRVVSGDGQVATPGLALPLPVAVRVTDSNELPYAGLRVTATGGTVANATVVTAADGTASFVWTPSSSAVNTLRFTVEGAVSPVAEAVALSRPAIAANGVVNAASFRPGIAPGAIATVFGSNLRGGVVTVDGRNATVFFSNNTQINFLAPAFAALAATAVVRIQNVAGASEPTSVPVALSQPGVFHDTATGLAAAIDRGSRIFEIYGTGFGIAPVTATVGGRPAEVLFSGAAPGFPGLHQINVRVDAGVPAGLQPAVLTTAGQTSNEVRIRITSPQ
ncbi:MAG: hypothetical protein FJW38_17225 [Acidobacteria bacterium]|nr:hypothetical protein [Acidobacteriota bacterium]